MELTTTRMTLIAADRESIEAELAGRSALATLLCAEVPEQWPPPLNDESSFRYVLSGYAPQCRGWWFWHMLLRRVERNPLAIGICGFKGPPTNGVVEIGYSVVDEQQKRGLATEACEALIAWAASSGEVTRVIALTLVGLAPSIRVLEKLGFTFEGECNDEDAPPDETVIKYARTL